MEVKFLVVFGANKTYSSMKIKAEKSCLSSTTKDEKIVENMAHEDEGNCSKTSSPRDGNPRLNKEDEELESTRGKMGEAKEENQRLKKMLDKVENDYRSLQLHFFDILQRDPPSKPVDSSEKNEFELEESEISLCLGKRPVDAYRSANERDVNVNDGLNLGLDLKGLTESGKCEMEKDNRSPERREVKTSRSESKEEGSESNVAKRARVSIRARCEAPTMHDGCQWRKYGQKTAKGNPCPRAYYRCTIAPSCPVRKQVQRCPQDMSILTTTYEGTHNHPLPVAATAMASTTSAAATMLMSRSSTSQGLSSITAPVTSTTANINGVNFTLFDNSTTRPYNFPNGSSLAPPTITLDLTTNTSTHLINRFSQAPKFSSTSLDFSSSSENIKFPTPWGNNSNYLNYNPSPPFNKTPFGSIGTLDFSKQPNGLTGNVRNSQSSSPSQQLFTETIAKVLTSAPSFQHAVAAAISNMVGSGNSTNSWRATGNGPNGYQNQVTGLATMAKPSFTSYTSNHSQSTLMSSLSHSKGSSSMAPSTSIDANNNQ